MADTIPIALLGISHKTAPVAVRDQVALSDEEQRQALLTCKAKFEIDGLLIISTCNRTEIYISGEHFEKSLIETMAWLSAFKKCDYYTDENLTYHYSGYQAINHFFQVVSGMDSQIIGEPQITGQVKEAYNRAFELKTTDTVINKMYDNGMHAEKIVRTDTYLSDGAVSVSFAGVELARQIFSDFKKKKVLLIGVGETAELAAKHFIDKGVQEIRIANRTESKAKILADKFGGSAFSLTRLAEAMSDADIVISATASENYIVDTQIINPVCAKRRFKPLLLIDLAMPRDIDPKVDAFESIYLYNLDHLNEIVALNMESRKKELPKAQKILNNSVNDFKKWIATHSMASVIERLRSHFDRLRAREIERLKNKLPENGKAEIEYLTQSIINKLMHQHIKSLKKNVHDPILYQEQVKFFFDLYEIEKD